MAHRLRVGILSAGEAGTGHAHAFARLPNVQVAALWSRTRQRARKLAAELRLSDVRLYDDWQTMVEDKDSDILSVATPTGLHREPFLMALDSRARRAVGGVARRSRSADRPAGHGDVAGSIRRRATYPRAAHCRLGRGPLAAGDGGAGLAEGAEGTDLTI